MAGIENFRAEAAEACEKVEVGDFVRSYDFEFSDDSFVMGKVLRITEPMEGCERYEILRLKKVVGHQVSIGGPAHYYPPVNGTRHSFGGYTNGVRKVDEESAAYWAEKLADWASDVDID